MPVDPGLYLMFLVAILAIGLTPGPDMLFILATSVSQGPMAGLFASLGTAAGMLVHTALVAAGLATALSTAPAVFNAIRYAGAAYLIYMGVQAWRHRSRPTTVRSLDPAPLRAVLVRAAVTNLLNPKIVLFYLAFLPQFVDRDRGHPTGQLLVLGLTFVVVGLVIDGTIGFLAGRLGSWLQRRRRADGILNRVAGTVFFTLAVRLVT